MDSFNSALGFDSYGCNSPPRAYTLIRSTRSDLIRMISQEESACILLRLAALREKPGVPVPPRSELW